MTPPVADRAVGFVGLGDQGAPMARAIAAAFHLAAWARREASFAALDGVEFTRCESLAALGRRCWIVGLCVGDDSDVRALLVEQGLLAAMPADGIVAIHSTISPATAREMTEAGSEHGVHVIDAPVSGGGDAAREKKLASMLGGDADACARATPVFETFSESVSYVGGPGTGQMVKLLNNALLLANMKSVGDMLADAEALGFDLRAVIPLLQGSSGSSTALRVLHELMTPGQFDHHVAVLRKDLANFVEAAASVGLLAPALADDAGAGLDGLRVAFARPGARRDG